MNPIAPEFTPKLLKNLIALDGPPTSRDPIGAEGELAVGRPRVHVVESLIERSNASLVRKAPSNLCRRQKEVKFENHDKEAGAAAKVDFAVYRRPERFRRGQSRSESGLPFEDSEEGEEGVTAYTTRAKVPQPI